MIDENMKELITITFCRIIEGECACPSEPCTACSIWKIRDKLATHLVENAKRGTK